MLDKSSNCLVLVWLWNIIYIMSYSILYILIVTCSAYHSRGHPPHLALVFAELPSSQLQLWRQHKDLLDPRAMSLPPGPRRCRFQLNEQISSLFFHDAIDTMDTQWIHNGLRKICTRHLFKVHIGLHVILVTVGGIFAVDLTKYTKSDFIKHQQHIESIVPTADI